MFKIIFFSMLACLNELIFFISFLLIILSNTNLAVLYVIFNNFLSIRKLINSNSIL